MDVGLLPHQMEFMERDQDKRVALVSGIGVGKTLVASMWLLQQAADYQNSIVSAQNYSALHKVVFAEIQRQARRFGMAYEYNKQDKTITFPQSGATIFGASSEAPDAPLGLTNISNYLSDESAYTCEQLRNNCEERCRGTDLKGRIIRARYRYTTTPSSLPTALWFRDMIKREPGIVIHATTFDNYLIGPDFVKDQIEKSGCRILGAVLNRVSREGEGYYGNGFSILPLETVGADTLLRTRNLQTVDGCDSIVQLEVTVIDTALQIVSPTLDFCEEMSAELMAVSNMPDYEWSTGELTPNITVTAPGLYPIVHLQGEGIDIAFTHVNQQYGEEYYSYVNGQHTTQGGTHQSAFKEHIARTIKDFFGKNYEYTDIRNGLVGAIAIKVIEPVFESQTKIKLGSLTMAPPKDSNGNPFPLSGVSVNKFIGDFIKENVDNYLHKNLDIAEIIQQKIVESERERKAMAGASKQAKERAKKVSLNNSKLRDCHIHFNDAKGDLREESSIFITEGLSASGSITKSRDVATQAVFSLRGKPLNSYGLTKKIVYENEEFNLLQAALNIEDGLDGLRYNKVIIATDADVDGMHIRLLMTTFFLQFFPELIKKGHVYILQTPLFRVRNKRKTVKKDSGDKIKISADTAGAAILKNQKSSGRSEFETRYCYSEQERIQAVKDLSPNPEITRFKGLGEISPDEFKFFIGPEMRLEQVTLHKDDQVNDLLNYYMGKNTMERQNFIIDNLVIEEDRPEEDFVEG